MNKMVIRGSMSALALSLLIGMSGSALAAWGDDKAAGHGDHHKSADKGKSWGGGMGGWGMSEGEGFMTARLRAVWTLDLSQEQKDKIRKIQRNARSAHWDLEDKIEMVSDKLFEQYKYPKRDAKAIGKIYAEIFDYRRQIIENGIETGNAVEKVLTTEQWKSLKKNKMKKWGGGWDQK
ncbi:MAG: hypothetical protein OEX07_08485 [Gammaproteobacteria bacterium]|nr:hypothetical protein [Gammaproteobacteria bacterium]